MKAQILKIAGVKTEAEFYKKFPSEEAFMKKHGKELKKAQNGVPVGGLPGMTFDDISGIRKMINKDSINSGISTITNSLGSLIGNVQDINQSSKDIKSMNAYGDIFKTVGENIKKPQRIPKKIDYNSMRSQNPNPAGIGTNYLFAENGGEIQNTYDPLDIYAGLGYEPLSDSSQVKQFQTGGAIGNKFNAAAFQGLAGNLGSAMGKGTGKGGNWSEIGSVLGTAASFIPGVGPIADAALQIGLPLIGGLFDSGIQNDLQAAQDNMVAGLNKATGQSAAQAIHGQFSANAKDGGWVSNDWMPQTITKFGDYSMDQLLAPPHDADMLRAGGHLKEYTSPSARAMYTGRMDDGGVMHSTNMMFDTDRFPRAEYGTQMAMGGDLQVHWGGSVEEMSQNPYLPGDGITYMPYGQSHDETNGKGQSGIGITYGDNPVEIERKEPMVKLQDGGSPDGNLVVYGNMVIPNYGVDELGDKKAKGKKFKNYVADLSKVEAKQNKIIDKSTKMVDAMNVATTFDKISMQAAEANIMGATAKLKDIADKKKTAAYIQNAILDTAEEYGLVSDALAKGKIVQDKEAMKQAKFGAKLETAANGTALKQFVNQLSFTERKAMARANGIKKFTGTPTQNEKLMKIAYQSASNPIMQPGQGVLANGALPAFNMFKGINPTPKKQYALTPSIYPSTGNAPAGFVPEGKLEGFNPLQGSVSLSPIAEANAPLDMSAFVDVGNTPYDATIVGKRLKGDKKDKGYLPFDWQDLINASQQAAPFYKNTSQLPLDPTQLLPENMALAMNQLQPVQAQFYNPMLQAQPYKVSLQDQRNEVIAQQRAASRSSYGNAPAAGQIAADASRLLSQIGGEENRINQAETMRAAEANRALMNDAQMKNLAIGDQQFVRQSETASKTKEQANVIANRVAEKINQNKLENRKQATYENMYPAFSFTKSGIAYKDPRYLAGINQYGSGKAGMKGMGIDNMTPKWESDENGQPVLAGYELKKEKKNAKNGAIVKAIKGL